MAIIIIIIIMYNTGQDKSVPMHGLLSPSLRNRFAWFEKKSLSMIGEKRKLDPIAIYVFDIL